MLLLLVETVAGLGKFITFEGADGCGKTSHANHLKVFLENLGIKVKMAREPGGTEFGEKIRELLLNNKDISTMSEILLFFASRYELVEKVIKPALQNGEWVICDRFYDSTLIYQGILKKFDIEKIMNIKHLVIGTIEPDITFVMNLPPEESIRRISGRKNNDSKYDTMNIEYYSIISENYKKLVSIFPYRAVLINSNKPSNIVSANIEKEILKHFSL